MNDQDLGFSWRKNKNGEVQIQHHGRLASTLRGHDAIDFLESVEEGDFDDQQQLMARITGNYKRGNEGQAAAHPRNKR